MQILYHDKMIITCEYCQSKFKVSDQAIGLHGRAVRCSNCNHQWIEKGSPAGKTNDLFALKETIENNNATLEKNKSFHRHKSLLEFAYVRSLIYFVFIFSFLILLTTITLSNSEYLIKTFKLYFPIFGDLAYSGNFKIEALHHEMKIVSHDNKYYIDLNLKIAIRNVSVDEKNLNSIKLTAFDNNRNKISNYTIKIDKYLKADEITTIDENFEKLPSSVTYIAIEIGNSYSLFFYEPYTLKIGD